VSIRFAFFVWQVYTAGNWLHNYCKCGFQSRQTSKFFKSEELQIYREPKQKKNPEKSKLICLETRREVIERESPRAPTMTIHTMNGGYYFYFFIQMRHRLPFIMGIQLTGITLCAPCSCCCCRCRYCC